MNLCKCQLEYLARLREDERKASALLEGRYLAAEARQSEATCSVTCRPLCEKAQKILSLHLQAEVQVANRLDAVDMDPQHYQLLCDRLASVLSFLNSPFNGQSPSAIARCAEDLQR